MKMKVFRNRTGQKGNIRTRGRAGSVRRKVLTGVALAALAFGGYKAGKAISHETREWNIKYSKELVERPSIDQLSEFTSRDQYAVIRDLIMDVRPRLERAAGKDKNLREIWEKPGNFLNLTPEQLKPFCYKEEWERLEPFLGKLKEEARKEGERRLAEYKSKK